MEVSVLKNANGEPVGVFSDSEKLEQAKLWYARGEKKGSKKVVRPECLDWEEEVFTVDQL